MHHWHGRYSFDDCFESLFPGGLKTVEFDFTFRLLLLGYLSGEIRDGADGIPDPAAAFGRTVANRRIWFTKTYPRTWAPAPETGELYVFDNRKHVVRYKGVYNDPKTIGGTWEIRSQLRILGGVQYEFPQITGTWNASKL